MRHGFWASGLLLALSGCYVDQPAAPAPYGYGPAGYAAPAGYPPPPPDYYPGYNYNNGAPTIIEGGAPVPLILFGGQWGFYDHDRRFHRAPDPVYRDLERRHAFNPPPHPGGLPPGGPPPGYAGPHGYGGPAGYRPPPPGGPGGPPPHPPGPPPPRPAGPPPPERHERPPNCPPGQRC